MAVTTLANPDDSGSLASAVTAASIMPLLLLDDSLRILAASLSFCRAFQLDRIAVQGAAFVEIGGGAWNIP